MKPAIIVAHGNSLNEHIEKGDFDLLKQYADTFAMNQIDRIYDRVTWRPTYWIWAEQVNQADTIDRMKTVVATHVVPKKSHCFIGKRFHHTLKRRFSQNFPTSSNDQSWPKLTFIGRCSNETHGGQAGDEHRVPTEWHLPVTCSYGGTVNTALQIAYMMGYKKVGVIGADLGYEDGEGNNFDGGYRAHIDGEWSKHDATLQDVHRMAREHYEANGREIYNCGIGGLLEAYERKPLKEFLCS